MLQIHLLCARNNKYKLIFCPPGGARQCLVGWVSAAGAGRLRVVAGQQKSQYVSSATFAQHCDLNFATMSCPGVSDDSQFKSKGPMKFFPNDVFVQF